MKSLIIGAGSIGVYLGTLLFDGGNEIVLCGRSKLHNIGKEIKINNDIYTLPPSISKVVQDESYDFVFVTCKIYDLIPVLKTLKDHNIQAKHRVFIQNGIIPEELKQEIQSYGDFHSISVFEGYRLVDSVLITHQTSVGWKTDDSQEGKEIAKVLSDVGINCTTTNDLDQARAEKTVMNCSVNALSAIHKKTLYELYHDDQLGKEVKNLFDEAYNVLSKLYTLNDLEKLRNEWYSITENMNHYSSTHQDITTAHKTEIPYINQLIVDLGKEHNIPTPHNDKILEEFAKMI